MPDQFIPVKTLFDKLKDIKEKIYDFDCSNPSLMEGNSGLIIFFDYYYSIIKDSTLIRQRNIQIDTLINVINDSKNLPLTYYDGLVGNLSLIKFLSFKNKTSYYIIEEDIDEYLFQIMRENLTVGKFDILHGGLGIFWYYIICIKSSTSVLEKKRFQSYIYKSLEIIEEFAIKDFLGYRWKNTVVEKGVLENQDSYNLGFAHGQPGILAVVSLASSHIDNKEIALRIINESSKYILSFYKKNNTSQFPSFYCSGVDLQYKSRLAWCYGDLSISLAINFASKCLNDKILNKISEEIALNSMRRIALGNTAIEDASLCHGSSGLSHMYNIWFEFTGNLAFKRGSDYWMLRTIDYLNNGNKFSDSNTLDSVDSKAIDIGFLTGIAGIGLSMISHINNKRSWDTFLMLS